MRPTLTLLSVPFLAGALHGQLVINELDYDQPSIDTHEFVELMNTGSAAYPLQYVRIVMVSGAGGGAAIYRTIEDPGWAALAAGDYFVVCGNGGLTPNCDVDATPDGDLIENGTPDAIALIDITDSTVIDMLSYEGDVPGVTETMGYPGSDAFGGGVGGPAENRSLSRWPDGSDTDNNSVDFIDACSTPGEANTNDTTNCALITTIATANLPSMGFHVFADPVNGLVWMHCAQLVAMAVTFDVFALDGSLIATRTTGATRQASWAWPIGERHGRMLLVRAACPQGIRTQRIFVP